MSLLTNPRMASALTVTGAKTLSSCLSCPLRKANKIKKRRALAQFVNCNGNTYLLKPVLFVLFCRQLPRKKVHLGRDNAIYLLFLVVPSGPAHGPGRVTFNPAVPGPRPCLTRIKSDILNSETNRGCQM